MTVRTLLICTIDPAAFDAGIDIRDLFKRFPQPLVDRGDFGLGDVLGSTSPFTGSTLDRQRAVHMRIVYRRRRTGFVGRRVRDRAVGDGKVRPVVTWLDTMVGSWPIWCSIEIIIVTLRTR